MSKVARIVLASTVLLLLACASAMSPEATAAQYLGKVSPDALAVLGRLYTTRLIAVMRQAAEAEDARAFQEHRPPERAAVVRRAKRAEVERWVAVWGDDPNDVEALKPPRVGAWTIFLAAHAAWAGELEAGRQGTEARERFRTALCALVTSLPAEVQGDARRALGEPLVATLCPVPVASPLNP